MSATWLKLITILCLYSAVLSGPESGGVVWRVLGGFITIQCRCPTSDPSQRYLSLKKGINQDEIFYKEKGSPKSTIAKGFTDRLQLNGEFPNFDIFIKNLTINDTGPYWCFYKKFDSDSSQMKTVNGKGSVLLVVTGEELGPVISRTSEMPKQCDPSDKNLVLLSVVISAAILLGIIIGFLIWIVLKTKSLRNTHSTHSTVKPRRATTNDVYEDMRGMRH